MGPALPRWCLIVNPWTGRSLFNVNGPREALLSERAGLIFLCSGLCPGGPVCLFRESLVPSWTCPLGSTMLQVGAIGLRVFTVGKQVALPCSIHAIKHSFRLLFVRRSECTGDGKQKGNPRLKDKHWLLPSKQTAAPPLPRCNYEGSWTGNCFDHCLFSVMCPLTTSPRMEVVDYWKPLNTVSIVRS